jgi:hypothetical protein
MMHPLSLHSPWLRVIHPASHGVRSLPILVLVTMGRQRIADLDRHGSAQCGVWDPFCNLNGLWGMAEMKHMNLSASQEGIRNSRGSSSELFLFISTNNEPDSESLPLFHSFL